MQGIRHRFFTATTAGLVLVTAAACTQQESQPSAEAALCTSVTTFDTALEDFRDLDPATASIEDVQAARGDIQAAWDDIKAEAVDLSEADEAAVDDAWNGVAQSIDDFPADEPIEEGLSGVQDAAGDVQTAFDQMRDGLGCSTQE
jgi:hypothetical protein